MINENVKLKVGDKVLIRRDLATQIYVSGYRPSIIDRMLKYRGQIAVITKICDESMPFGYDSYVYCIDLDKGFWSWSNYMFDQIISDFIDD